jgi:predicted DNA-binding protein with PD1-like motif
MRCIPLRLEPGSDLRSSLEAAACAAGDMPAFVVCGIGSLSQTRLRLAGAASETAVQGDVEILTLSGTLTPDGAHLHMSVADAQGRVLGGHVCRGNVVRTTAEVLLVPLPAGTLAREQDPQTGYRELVVRPAPGGFGHAA